jgi:broad specificity phosphatase PhoE
MEPLPELVVLSPLCRALQTGILVFESLRDNKNVPFVAYEMAREESGVHVCDRRRPSSRLQAEFPMVDFSSLEQEEDVIFRSDQRETKQEVAERAYQFLTWLAKRPERHVGVVSHSSWLLTLFNAVFENNEDNDNSKLKTWFQTGEMRSVVLEFISSANPKPQEEQCST